MKIWKVLIFAPYILIFGWTQIWFSVMMSGTFGGAVVGGAAWAMGVVFAFIYTVILAAALVIRWIILRRRRR
ncbi:MAG: hypothetical protein OEZ48_01270 [Candidatus Bathyarchaeota archaeon]|nr:hypothetical protein [Candidatus Bathyarchaeota archaeon]MDH5686489.1 hypothetical protein [Candidatus Bathyarchaeota archaeon]